MKTLLHGLILLLAAGAALAVPTLRVELPRDIDLYYIGDLDPAGTMNAVAEDIWLVIGNFQPADAGTYQISIELHFSGESEALANGTMTADNVPAPPGGEYRVSLAAIRANDVWFGDAHAQGRGDYNEDFIERISGNVLPSGLYTVRAVIDGPGGRLERQDFFTVTDPRRVDLLLPMNGLPVFSEQPTLSWTGRAREYALRVCLFDPERHSSLYDAIEAEPEWEVSGRRLMGQTSVVYGSLDLARPLRPGGVYVWMVEAVLNTTSGERRFPSAVWSFQVREGNGHDDERLLANLLEGLSPSQLAGIARLLEGLSLNGPILIDGQEVDVAELRALVRRLGEGELNIASIRVE
jgi:hypothetical protein